MAGFEYQGKRGACGQDHGQCGDCGATCWLAKPPTSDVTDLNGRAIMPRFSSPGSPGASDSEFGIVTERMIDGTPENDEA